MCNCRAAVDQNLASRNARVAVGMFFGNSRIDLAPPMVVLEKIDGNRRGKLPNLVASYCPFCGKKYEGLSDGAGREG